MKYWLMKTEPETYSIDDLAQEDNQTDYWDGVRNYQARNIMRDQMKVGDQVLFYHSNCKVPGVVGLAEVAREGYPDFTSWDPASKYYDAKSSEDNPRWFMVDIKWKAKFNRVVSLKEMRAIPALAEMKLLQRGQRLSIQPVSKDEYQLICELGQS
ncbi:MAG: EVE domain-containing protein [Acidobacteria bacterium]|nr:MAG: EVE domain-containing protein [Acidobacteriota bacterium]